MTIPSVFAECGNCKQNVLASNFSLHEAHCYRHMVLCEYCGRLLHRTEKDSHIQERVSDILSLEGSLERGDVERVESALSHGGADISKWITPKGQSLLHLVAQRAESSNLAQSGGVARLLRELLKHGADVNHRDQVGMTPLHAAAKAASVVAVSMLINAGADVSAPSVMGSTPLSVATGEEVRLLLLQAGASVRSSSAINSKPQSPRAVAAASALGFSLTMTEKACPNKRSEHTSSGSSRTLPSVPRDELSCEFNADTDLQQRPSSSRHARRLLAAISAGKKLDGAGDDAAEPLPSSV